MSPRSSTRRRIPHQTQTHCHPKAADGVPGGDVRNRRNRRRNLRRNRRRKNTSRRMRRHCRNRSSDDRFRTAFSDSDTAGKARRHRNPFRCCRPIRGCRKARSARSRPKCSSHRTSMNPCRGSCPRRSCRIRIRPREDREYRRQYSRCSETCKRRRYNRDSCFW